MRFDTAAELYIYLTETMPWWSPGNRSVEEYWDVTAYLLQQNGVLPPELELNAGNAMVISIRPSSEPPGDIRPMALILVVTLVIAAALLAIENRWFYKSSS